MTDKATISDRLKQVLRDMEKMTNDIQTIQAQVSSAANNDFLTNHLDKSTDI